MSNATAFQPMGKTVKVVATGPANTQSNVFTITADSPCNQYYIVNGDTAAAVYVKISTTASFNVALPDVVPDYVLALPPYEYRVFTGPPVSQFANVYAKVIGDATNSSCYICPGEGI